MKRTLLISLICYVPHLPTSAQSTFLSCGGDHMGASGSMAYSIGQLLTSTLSLEQTLFNGVQLPDLSDPASTPVTLTSGIKIFSNPQNSYVTILIEEPKDELNYRLYHLNGTFLYQERITETRFSFSLDPGFYLLSVIDHEGISLVKTKIVKF